jgi:multidrug efflux pump subunit AcrA (membrane-fusion protein)
MADMLILALAALAALVVWDSYVAAPWTRDGRVRARVASIVPQVSGQITEVRVVNNQFVHQDDVLYVIDPFDFQVALDTAKAQLRQNAADLQVKRMQAERLGGVAGILLLLLRCRSEVGQMQPARLVSVPATVRLDPPSPPSKSRRMCPSLTSEPVDTAALVAEP